MFLMIASSSRSLFRILFVTRLLSEFDRSFCSSRWSSVGHAFDKKKKKKSPALLSATPSEPLFDSCTLLRGHIAGRACSCLLPSPQPPTRSQLFIGGDCVSLAFVFTVVATWVLSNCFNLNLSPCSRANGLLCVCVCVWTSLRKTLKIIKET